MWSSQLPTVIPSQGYSHLHSSISISITDEVTHQSPRRSTVANLSSPRKCPLMTRVPIQREFLVFSKATGTTGPNVGRLEYWHVSRFSWSNSDDRLTRQVSSVLISNQNPALCKHTLKTMSYNRLELCSANVIVIVSDWLIDGFIDWQGSSYTWPSGGVWKAPFTFTFTNKCLIVPGVRRALDVWSVHLVICQASSAALEPHHVVLFDYRHTNRWTDRQTDRHIMTAYATWFLFFSYFFGFCAVR